jgi:homoserine kinase
MSDKPEDAKPDNETMREVKRAKARKQAVDAKSTIDWKTAAGVGIGSAALVAALMYANKARKKDGQG